jgi:hypothetical protein
LWAFFFLKLKQYTSAKKFYVWCIALLGVVGIAANWYYFHSFLPSVGGYKFISQSLFETLSQSLLAIGRYFFLIIYPASALPTPHSKFAVENFIGLISILVFLITLYFNGKRHPEKKSSLFVFISYFFIHLIPVLFNSTVFVSDTYLLNASLGIYLLFILLINDRRLPLFMVAIYSLFLAATNVYYTSLFANAKSVWLYSFNREQSIESTLVVAEIMISDHQYDRAYALTKDLLQNEEAIPVHAKSIYLKSASLEERTKLTKNISFEHPAKYFFLVLLAAESSNQPLVDEYSKKLLMFNRYLDWVPIQKRKAIDLFLKKIMSVEFNSAKDKKVANIVRREYEAIFFEF